VTLKFQFGKGLFFGVENEGLAKHLNSCVISGIGPVFGSFLLLESAKLPNWPNRGVEIAKGGKHEPWIG
jgi:hypothetical protein